MMITMSRMKECTRFKRTPKTKTKPEPKIMSSIPPKRKTVKDASKTGWRQFTDFQDTLHKTFPGLSDGTWQERYLGTQQQKKKKEKK